MCRLPLLAAGYFAIAPYGTLQVVLPLLGGGDTVGRQQRGLQVAARLRGGGEESWEAAVLVTGRGRDWEASRVEILCDTADPFPYGPHLK